MNTSSDDEQGNFVVTQLKWFEPRKGFGFVHEPQQNIDAFLHFSVLKQAGYEQLAPGATIRCQLIKGPKGQQVSAIESIDESTATEEARPSRAHEGDFAADGNDPVEAEVKFYNAAKGFGFATVNSLEQDVFLPGKLMPMGQELDSGQKLRIRYRQGDRGLVATSIELV